MKKLSYFMCAILMIVSIANAESIVYMFTNAGQTGRLGPNQTQLNTAYSGTTLAGQVTSSNGIQYWTVPLTGEYIIEAWGAAGADGTYGNNTGSYYRNGGNGARIRGTFTLNVGDQLKILVGQMGTRETSYVHQAGGGGGGTFVTYSNNSALIIAGGGGGGGNGRYGQTNGDPGQTSTSGSQNGGSNGNGGNASYNGYSGAGGGLISDGGNWSGNNASYGIYSGGDSFVNGGNGGYSTNWAVNSQGGFGGGGGSALLGGGGGGYSGGGVIGSWSSTGSAGGGGSYNVGTDTYELAGANEGQGFVTFERIIPEPCSITLLCISIFFVFASFRKKA